MFFRKCPDVNDISGNSPDESDVNWLHRVVAGIPEEKLPSVN